LGWPRKEHNRLRSGTGSASTSKEDIEMSQWEQESEQSGQEGGQEGGGGMEGGREEESGQPGGEPA